MTSALIEQYRPFSLGFERAFHQMEELLHKRVANASNFPPYNIYKSDDGYTIELALAGYRKSDITIEHNKQKGVLTIKGKSTREPMDGKVVLRNGIAHREFIREILVSDGIEVDSAEMTDGVLWINLVNPIQSENKPLQIPIK